MGTAGMLQASVQQGREITTIINPCDADLILVNLFIYFFFFAFLIILHQWEGAGS